MNRGSPGQEVDGGFAEVPLISCIVPTADRRSAIPLMLDALRAQQYPAIELVVVDGGADPVEDLVRAFPRVRYVRAPRWMRLGARRELACAIATGDIIAHWDDDDWYAEDRLSRQAEPLLRGLADVSGLVCRHVLQLDELRWWRMSDWLHAHLFFADVHGGTLLYRKSLLGGRVRYPNVNLAEDKGLLQAILRAGGRLARVDGDDLFAYVRHGRNTWTCPPGRLVRASEWLPGVAPARMDAELQLRYRSALGASPPPTFRGSSVIRHARLGSTFVDCLGATEFHLASAPPTRALCVAVVVSEEMVGYFATLLDSLRRFRVARMGTVTVLAPGSARLHRQLESFEGVEVVPCRPLRGGRSLKGALYSLSNIVPADSYLCLDADLIAVASLNGLLEHLDGAEGPRLCAVAEGGAGERRLLAAALRSDLAASAAETERLLSRFDDRGRNAIFVNDGVILANRAGLSAVDREVRAHPEWIAWQRSRTGVPWRQKGVLSLALATTGELNEMDSCWNVQLHAESVATDSMAARFRATVEGSSGRILHFNGLARRHWSSWARQFKAPTPGLLGEKPCG